MTPRRWALVALAVAVVALLAGRTAAGLYADYAWYASVGAVTLWTTSLANAALLHGAAAVAGTLFVFANLYGFRRSIASLIVPGRVADEEIAVRVPDRAILAAIGALAVVVGIALAFAQASWMTLARFRFTAPFRETDPHFGEDLSFWVGWLPLERAWADWASVTLALTIALVLVLYTLTASVRWHRGRLLVSGHARRHAAVLCALVLGLLAWEFRLDAYDRTIQGSGPAGLFTATDLSVLVRSDLTLVLLSIASALVVLRAGWTGQAKVAFGAATGLLLLGLALHEVAPVIADRVTAPGVRAARDRPFADTRAVYSRRAYAVERIGGADSSLAYSTGADVARGVPLWDAGVVARAVARATPGGASFAAAALARDSGGSLVYGVARRPADAADADLHWSWLRVRADVADARGAPLPASGPPDDERPLLPVYVYPGARGYAVAPDSEAALAAPALSSWAARLAHAWREQNFRLLVGDLPASPRLFVRRDVSERVDAVAPFLLQGATAAPAVVGDTLYWLVHLYSVSESYPLSAHVALGGLEWSYLRHAAVAIVNGHTGQVRLVADAEQDPMLQAWTSALPELFAPWTAVDGALERQVPPPDESLAAQAVTVGRYGARADDRGTGDVTRIVPDSADDAPTPLALPNASRIGEAAAITDRAGRLVQVLVATGGATGRVVRFDAPAAERAGALAAELDRAGDSAAATRAPRGARGSIRPFVTSAGLGAVQARYALKADGSITLAGMAAVLGATRGAGLTVADALGVATESATSRPADRRAFRERARELYDAMRAALQRGDLRAFGDAYAQLGALLAEPVRPD